MVLSVSRQIHPQIVLVFCWNQQLKAYLSVRDEIFGELTHVREHMSRGAAGHILVVVDYRRIINPEVEKKLADISCSPQHFAEVLSHGRIHFPPRQQSIQT